MANEKRVRANPSIKAAPEDIPQDVPDKVRQLFEAGATDQTIATELGVFISRVRPIRTALGLIRPTTPTKAYDPAEDIKWLEQFRGGGGRVNRAGGYVPTGSSMSGGFIW